MRNLLWIFLLLFIIICSSGYLLEQRSNKKLYNLDTIISIKSNKWTNGKDTVYYVVNGFRDTVDWYGYVSGTFASKKEMITVKKQVDSMAYYFGRIPYIGYTLLNPDFWNYYGRED